MKDLLTILLLPILLTGCSAIELKPSTQEMYESSVTRQANDNIQSCQSRDDCMKLNIDTSFCDDGIWECIESSCQYTCEL